MNICVSQTIDKWRYRTFIVHVAEKNQLTIDELIVWDAFCVLTIEKDLSIKSRNKLKIYVVLSSYKHVTTTATHTMKAIAKDMWPQQSLT